MNLREGRIGVREGISIAAIAMCTSGLFTFDTKIPAPAAVRLISRFLPAESLQSFFLSSCLRQCGAAGQKNLSELILSAFGGTIGAAVTLVLMLCLLAAAYSPLSGFIQAMHGLFFNGIGYGKLAMYVLPTVLFCCMARF